MQLQHWHPLWDLAAYSLWARYLCSVCEFLATSRGQRLHLALTRVSPLIPWTLPDDPTDMCYTVGFGDPTKPTESREGMPQWEGTALSLDGKLFRAGQ